MTLDSAEDCFEMLVELVMSSSSREVRTVTARMARSGAALAAAWIIRGPPLACTVSIALAAASRCANTDGGGSGDAGAKPGGGVS